MEKKTFSREFFGRNLKVELGQLAQRANGSVLVSYGDTVLLATAVMGDKDREEVNYLPLSVEYEERLYAAGKIKGSRFIKREGRPSDDAILSGRMIDRTLRPRFDGRLRRDIQIVVTVLSFDKENDPDVMGIFAASLALSLSDVPFNGPVAGVRVSRQDNKFLINPTYEQRNLSDLEVVVSGTKQRINMLEGGAQQTPEDIVLAAIGEGQKAYEELIAFQEEIINQVKPIKAQPKIKEIDKDFEEKVKSFVENRLEEAVYANNGTKLTKLQELEDELADFIKENESQDPKEKITDAFNILDEMINDLVHQNVLKKDLRPDGRRLDEVRSLDCLAGILPRTHGSALFTRGTTQALSVVTLGAPSEKQIIDGIEEEYKKRFIHHYNFPPFSVGETGRFGSPGRREIGHGALAERSLMQVIPTEEEFPYTIRVVSEILSSNGSSSMASTCGSSLALMDAGVPVKAAVAGIAMGLILDETSGQYKVLTDIQGPEDHHGDMDCKITGTAQGICGMQMDVKIEGIDMKILTDTFQQARQAHRHILEAMNQAIATPRPNLSEFAPRIITLQINPDKIREVIGPGGKVINEIIDKTGVKIDIEDSGMVFITSENEAAAAQALEWIKNIVREVVPGEIFQGRVTRLINFGAFVEILPGQEGLVHISELAPYRVNKVDDIVKVGDVIVVKVKNIDDQGRINLSLKDAAKSAGQTKKN